MNKKLENNSSDVVESHSEKLSGIRDKPDVNPRGSSGFSTLSDKIHIGYEKNLKVEDVKEFIKERKARIRNQLRIHWSWLKNKKSKEVSDFINNIINKGAGKELLK